MGRIRVSGPGHGLGRAMRLACVGLAVAGGLVACGGGAADAPTASAADVAPGLTAAPQAAAGATDQLIVRMLGTDLAQQYGERAAEFALSLSVQAGVKLRALRQTQGGSLVLGLPEAVSNEAAEQMARRLAQRADVAFAEPDRVLQPDLLPNDVQFKEQWALSGNSQQTSALGVAAAWTLTTGSPATVVAVLDNGVLAHNELAGRLLPGHDFVSNPLFGNDGDGRDADPTDPGDWIDGRESWLSGATPRASTWHGTHVAGIVAAQGQNGVGVAGINWRTRVLPVRVLGRGGGYVSDIADGLQWAVGAVVPGVPVNTTPARVVNMSLGGGGSCSREMQGALDEAWARGAVVVASAGNAAQDVANTMLAGCRQVLAVAALGQQGELAPYSNFGATVAIAAPGGNYPRDSGILSLGDSGSTAPRRDSTYTRKQGTSMAAPQVAGVLSLMLAANPDLAPAQARQLLQAAARPFRTGTGSDCNVNRCGAGMLDAAAAVSLAALHPASTLALAQSQATPLAWPLPGLWQAPGEAGRQYALDVRGDALSLAVYHFDAQGRPTWAQASLVHDPVAQAFVGQLFSHEGGAPLTGAYRAPRPARDLGAVQLSVTGPGEAVLLLGGSRKPLQHIAASAATPGLRTGFWWDATRPGSSYLVAETGGQLSLTAQVYAANGAATWYRAELLPTEGGRFGGVWSQWSGGAGLSGPGRTPSVASLAGARAEWALTGVDSASLVLPDGVRVALQAGTAANSDPLEQSARLLGVWQADYTALAQVGSERWTLASLRASDTYPGDHNVTGFNQWGGWMLGGWSSRYANFSVFAPGLLLDDFYVFQLDADSRAQGCYHVYHLALNRLSDCFPLTATRQGSAAVAASALAPSSVSVVGDRRKESALLAVAAGPVAPVLEVASVGDGAVTPAIAKAGASPSALVQLQGWQQLALSRR